MSNAEFNRYVGSRVNAMGAELERVAKEQPMQAGSRIVDIFVDAFRDGLAKNMTREDVVATWNTIYDAYLSKIDIPGSMDALLHGLIKTLGASLIGRAYDRLVAE